MLVWRLDRWGRSVTDLLATLQELEHLGVGFRLADRGAGPDHARRTGDGRPAGDLRRVRTRNPAGTNQGGLGALTPARCSFRISAAWRPQSRAGPAVCRSAAHAPGRPRSFPQDLAFELGEDGQQSGHRSAGGRGQVQRLGQRDEADAQMLQFLKRGQQVRHRPAPAVQPPHQHQIDLSAARSFQQFLARLPLAAPEPTSRTCIAIVHPRRSAYSRIARFCIASVCWSLVETRA